MKCNIMHGFFSETTPACNYMYMDTWGIHCEAQTTQSTLPQFDQSLSSTQVHGFDGHTSPAYNVYTGHRQTELYTLTKMEEGN